MKPRRSIMNTMSMGHDVIITALFAPCIAGEPLAAVTATTIAVGVTAINPIAILIRISLARSAIFVERAFICLLCVLNGRGGAKDVVPFTPLRRREADSLMWYSSVFTRRQFCQAWLADTDGESSN